MKGNKFSILAVFGAFLTHSAFGAAQLPQVSVDRGTVSAKELFGVKTAPVKQQNTSAAQRPVAQRQTVNNNADVLIPRRPNSELWVNNGQKRPNAEPSIRMPRQDEFVKIREDYNLPEEHIGNGESYPQPLARAATPQQPVRVAKKPAPVKANVSRKAQLDDAIARMVEQKNQQQVARARSAVDNFSNNINNVEIAMEYPQKNTAAQPDYDRIAEEQRVMERKPVVRVSANEFAPVNPEEVPMNRLSPRELKRAFYKSYLSENKHLSTYSMDDFDSLSSDNWEITTTEGFIGEQSISSSAQQPKALEIRMSFANNDSSLSQDNFNLLSEYAAIVANNPKRAVQISVSEDAVKNTDSKRLAARRLAIINQVLIDSGIHESRIIPVLADRDDGSFVLRVISTDQFKVLRQTERDMFGDKKSQTTTRSLSW